MVSENVHVYVRVRPLTSEEKRSNQQTIISLNEDQRGITINNPAPKDDVTQYRFDRVFDEYSPQISVYKSAAASLVEKAFEGYNGTIFAYGQTGSGKTYTMSNHNQDIELNGIIPNAFSHIFTQISRLSDKKFVVAVTYLEIYNEQLRDLLSNDTTKKLEIREDKDVGTYVKNLRAYTVESAGSLMKILSRGNKNRVTKSTNMNKESSRSHTIMTISIESKNDILDETTLGKLNLVDLAGSERTGRSQVTGDCLRETCNINLSLLVLGNVISALVDGKSTHIPYRNSKLTRLLQNSLGGNSKTAMIAAISPCEQDLEETKCTLRYASRVKYIKNNAHVNVGQGYIQGFEQEIEELQRKLELLSQQNEVVNLPKKSKSRTSQKSRNSDLKECDEEIKKSQREKDELLQKITSIQRKLIVGGENLFEKAQHQQFIIESSEAEIEDLDRTNQELEDTLSQIGSEKLDIEEKYNDLQEEDAAITEKIAKVQKQLELARRRCAFDEHEHQREIENLQDTQRLLLGEIRIAKLIVDKCISKKYQREIESRIKWDEDSKDFYLASIAFAGNNILNKDFPVGGDNAMLSSGGSKKHAYNRYPKKKKN